MIPRIYLICSLWLISFFAISPIKPEARAGLEDAGYNLFYRFGGILSTMDLYIFLGLLIIIFDKRMLSGILNINLIKLKEIKLIFFIYLFSFIVGLVLILFSQIDFFDLRIYFRALFPFIYLLYFFVFTKLVINFDANFIDHYITSFKIITAINIIKGVLLLILFFNNPADYLSKDNIPIILYSEIDLFWFPLIFILINYFRNKKLGVLDALILSGMIFFVFISTRRLNYILLILYSGFAIYLSYLLGWIARKSLKIILFTFIILFLSIFILLLLIFPDVFDTFLFIFNTMIFWTGNGLEYTGGFRVAQLQNMLANYNQLVIPYLSGFGIGTQWYEFIPLPEDDDPLGNLMSYDIKTYTGNSYFPFFHIPFAAAIFRFGPILYVLLFYLALNICRKIIMRCFMTNTADKLNCIFFLSILPITFFNLLILGDSPTPMAYIQLGIFLALIDKFLINLKS